MIFISPLLSASGPAPAMLLSASGPARTDAKPRVGFYADARLVRLGRPKN